MEKEDSPRPGSCNHFLIVLRNVFDRGRRRRNAWTGDQRTELAQLRTSEACLDSKEKWFWWSFGLSVVTTAVNVEPHIKTWHQRYAEKGLAVIGVHSPEFTY